ncbi:MAG: carbohydrate ABC transporter permease [Defluviitaleaceae bacterium]|nr:carbohydrate ABC transporter permease [Defluviitaleaceae bacterium]
MIEKLAQRLSDYRARIKVKRGFFTQVLVFIVLATISYEFVFPLFRMIMISLMTRHDLLDPTVTWIPTEPTFANLRIAFEVMDAARATFNSMWYSSMLAAFQTIVAALTGYALARFDFKFKRFWLVMLIVTFVLPIPLLSVPRNMMFIELHRLTEIRFIGTIYPQTILAILGQGVYSSILVLIFYNFMQMIPKSLDEAAEIDGANKMQVFYHIGIRISLSTLLVVFLLSVVWNWNETFMTSMFLRGSIDLLPSNLIRFENMFSSNAPQMPTPGGAMAMVNEAYIMAGTLISMAPLVILYFFVQKRFIKGIESTGITGE